MALAEEERTLIKLAVKRDREAFAKLYLRYHDVVMARIMPITRNRDEAEDLTSEVFLRAWNAIDRFEPREVSIAAWLCTIAQRVAFSRLRRRRPSVSLSELSLEADPLDSPEAMAERAFESAEVREALTGLSDLQRHVISQRFEAHQSYEDLGAQLGKPAGTVRVIHHRAITALRGILKENRRLERGVSAGAIK